MFCRINPAVRAELQCLRTELKCLRTIVDERQVGTDAVRTQRYNDLNLRLEGFPLLYMSKLEYEKAHEPLVKDMTSLETELIGLRAKLDGLIAVRQANWTDKVLTVVITAVLTGVAVGLLGALINHLLMPKP